MSPTLILIVGGGLALILLIIGITVSMSSEKSMVEERLGRYIQEEKAAETTAKPTNTAPITEWLNKRVQRSNFGEKISQDLARADIRLKPGEYIAVMIICSGGLGIILWIIGKQSILLGLLGVIFGLFVPSIYVKREQGQRLVRFNGQLADMLNLMVNGLRAGYSVMQAMEAVSKELPAPISDEFRRVVQEMQLGVTMEQALDNLLRRIPSDDLDLVITAINVQREVGGNLAEIMDTISFTIRERVRIKGEIRVLTTQATYSGRFLSLLPVIVMLILYVLNRDYMMQFFASENFPCGYIALGLALGLIVSGYFVMNNLGKVEV